MRNLFAHIWALLVLAGRRLRARRSLALAAALGLTVAVALAMSVPLYADAVYQRVLLEQLEADDGFAGRPAFAYKFSYIGAWHGAVQWEDVQPLDRYVLDRAGAELGLPQQLVMRYLRTDNFQLFPAGTTDYANAGDPLAWLSFATIHNLEPHITLLEGRWPQPAGPDDAAEVLMSDALALRLGLHPGEDYIAFRRVSTPEGEEITQIPVRIAGIWVAVDPEASYWCCRQATFQDTLIVPAATFADRLSPALSDEVYVGQWYLVMDGSNVHADDVDRLLSRIAAVRHRAGTLLPEADLDLSPEERLLDYRRDARKLTTLLFAFSLPVVVLVLVFVSLVMSLAAEEQRNELAVLRSRGATLGQILILTVLEGVLLAAVALVLGALLALALARLTGHARSFLDFSNPQALRVALTPDGLRAGLSAAGLALLAYVLPVLGAARRSIVTYKQERARALQAPWWQRAWLDLLLLIPAAYGFYTLREEGGLAAPGMAEGADPWQNPLLFLLPALALLALSLLLLRVLPWVLGAVAWLLAPTRNVGLLLAARQLARTPSFYNGPVLLLILTLSLGTFTGSIARTLDRHLYEVTYYRTGADVTVIEGSASASGMPGFSAADDLFFPPMDEHLRLPGVQAAARVGRYNAFGNLGGERRPGTFIGIDRLDFPRVAYWRSDFGPAPLGGLMNELARLPDGVLLPRSVMAANAVRPGDLIRVTVSLAGQPTDLELRVAGGFRLFPGWYPEDGPLFVGNLDYIFEQAGSELPYEVWMTTAPSADEEAIADGIEAMDLRIMDWDSARTVIEQEQKRPERQGLFGLLSIGFVATAALTVAGFSLYALFSSRRRYVELGVLRAIGLSARQTAGLLAWELSALVAVGLAVGTGLGVWVSRLFIPYLQPATEARIPPFVVNIAWPAVFNLYALFALLCAGAMALLALQLRRMRIFEAIKLGETT